MKTSFFKNSYSSNNNDNAKNKSTSTSTSTSTTMTTATTITTRSVCNLAVIFFCTFPSCTLTVAQAKDASSFAATRRIRAAGGSQMTTTTTMTTTTSSTWTKTSASTGRTNPSARRFDTFLENRPLTRGRHDRTVVTSRAIRAKMTKARDPPTTSPTQSPTDSPSSRPSRLPSSMPSAKPSLSKSPTWRPSFYPTSLPTTTPSVSPSPWRSSVPSHVPTPVPTTQPTLTQQPSFWPTHAPSISPTNRPSDPPSAIPTHLPSISPSDSPSLLPSMLPAHDPSMSPTNGPSFYPSNQPSDLPSSPSLTSSSKIPSPSPTHWLSVSPSQVPSSAPTVPSSQVPSLQPSTLRSAFPSVSPTQKPTNKSLFPSQSPSSLPFSSSSSSSSSSARPSNLPSDVTAQVVVVVPLPDLQLFYESVQEMDPPPLDMIQDLENYVTITLSSLSNWKLQKDVVLNMATRRRGQRLENSGRLQNSVVLQDNTAVFLESAAPNNEQELATFVQDNIVCVDGCWDFPGLIDIGIVDPFPPPTQSPTQGDAAPLSTSTSIAAQEDGTTISAAKSGASRLSTTTTMSVAIAGVSLILGIAFLTRWRQRCNGGGKGRNGGDLFVCLDDCGSSNSNSNSNSITALAANSNADAVLLDGKMVVPDVSHTLGISASYCTHNSSDDSYDDEDGDYFDEDAEIARASATSLVAPALSVYMAGHHHHHHPMSTTLASLQRKGLPCLPEERQSEIDEEATTICSKASDDGGNSGLTTLPDDEHLADVTQTRLLDNWQHQEHDDKAEDDLLLGAVASPFRTSRGGDGGGGGDDNDDDDAKKSKRDAEPFVPMALSPPSHSAAPSCTSVSSSSSSCVGPGAAAQKFLSTIHKQQGLPSGGDAAGGGDPVSDSDCEEGSSIVSSTTTEYSSDKEMTQMEITATGQVILYQVRRAPKPEQPALPSTLTIHGANSSSRKEEGDELDDELLFVHTNNGNSPPLLRAGTRMSAAGLDRLTREVTPTVENWSSRVAAKDTKEFDKSNFKSPPGNENNDNPNLAQHPQQERTIPLMPRLRGSSQHRSKKPLQQQQQAKSGHKFLI